MPILEANGNNNANIAEIMIIIRIPPPTGVPAFLSCNLSKRGIFPFLGASFLLVNFNLYSKLMNGTMNTPVTINENIRRPRDNEMSLDKLIVNLFNII